MIRVKAGFLSDLPKLPTYVSWLHIRVQRVSSSSTQFVHHLVASTTGGEDGVRLENHYSGRVHSVRLAY